MSPSPFLHLVIVITAHHHDTQQTHTEFLKGPPQSNNLNLQYTHIKWGVYTTFNDDKEFF